MSLTAAIPNLSGHQRKQTLCSWALQGIFYSLGALMLRGETLGNFGRSANPSSPTAASAQANAPTDVSIENEEVTLC